MSRNADTCPICSTMVKTIPLNRRDCIGIDCPRCGVFVEVSLLNLRSGKTDKFPPDYVKKAISAWIRQQTSLGSMPTLDITLIERALDVPEPTIIDKSERLLEECGRRTKHFRQNVFDPCEPLLAITWSADANELRYLVHLLREQEYLISSVVSDSIVLSVQGITKVEAQRDKIITDQAFVAMSFGAELDSVYDKGLYIGIKSAGYKPFRMDRHDHVNRIDDEMISQIRQSRFTVADFTGQRQSVYFEAGLALGLGQHVIWTCKKSEIEHLHFDVRQYSTIDWEDEDNLSKKVQSRIEAVLGPGPNR